MTDKRKSSTLLCHYLGVEVTKEEELEKDRSVETLARLLVEPPLSWLQIPELDTLKLSTLSIDLSLRWGPLFQLGDLKVESPASREETESSLSRRARLVTLAIADRQNPLTASIPVCRW